MVGSAETVAGTGDGLEIGPENGRGGATRPHGGDLAAARTRFGEPSRGWLDLSTGINPIPYPIPPVAAEAWTRLPGRDALAGLETAAAAAFGAVAADLVVAAPGTQALIQLLPRLVPARRVAVVGVTYAEHAAAWAATGATVATVADAFAEADVVVVVNPNNPDGRIVATAELAAAAARLAARGGLLVVDEAFADLTPALSIVPDLPADGVVVLRSFGKTYGLGGARLGFAVAGRGLAGQIRAALGPWPVSGPAIAVATAAYGDPAWRQQAAARLAADGRRLDALTALAGFRLIGGTALFRLYSHSDAPHWDERLGRAGILVRSFPAQPDRLRFGLPGRADDWARLAEVVAAPTGG
jgi:cobalamin biosynthetic protein CobC